MRSVPYRASSCRSPEEWNDPAPSGISGASENERGSLRYEGSYENVTVSSP